MFPKHDPYSHATLLHHYYQRITPLLCISPPTSNVLGCNKAQIKKFCKQIWTYLAPQCQALKKYGQGHEYKECDISLLKLLDLCWSLNNEAQETWVGMCSWK